MKKIFTILLVLISIQSFSQSTTLVISQVYGGGGNAGAPFNADFLELHNISGVAQSTSGLSVQYASATTTGAWTGVFALPAASIPAGGYYLIRMSTIGAIGAALPTPDAAPSAGNEIAMSATNGRVALVNGITPLSACPTASVIDLVGFGSSICFETLATPVLSNTTAALRNNNGCTDTDNNSLDFTVAAPAPRNSASTVVVCGAASPTLTASALSSFGNVCINTTAGPNSFTITGTALTGANVTVGALAGFTYSTTAAGTYTSSLSLTQPGGSYSQQIFVKFSPTLIQSYNGNIPVSGGGATAINVAAAGAGINISVTTGAASAITATSATLAGNAVTTCTAITAYGIEYSLTNNFPNGTGTQVASTNINGSGNYTSAVSGLSSSLTYYYKAYATNARGTVYGSQMSFVTSVSPVLLASALTGFGNVCINTTTGPNSFTITGNNLNTTNVTVGALSGFMYSTTAAGTYISSLSLSQPGGAYSQIIYVKFTPTAVQSYNGNIPVGGGGAPSINVAAMGSGINSAPTVTTGAASAITTTSATLAGTIPANGCTAITTYGVEYSTTNGFPNGTGTAVASSNLSGVNFSSALTGLAPGTTYYYHAYATNAGGTRYGSQGSFTTSTPVLTTTPLTAFGSICVNTTAGPNSFTIISNAVTAANITVGPLNGYTFSTTATGTYNTSLSLTHPAGSYTQTIFVMFSPTVVQSYNGNIPVSGGGASTINVTASGSGSNTAATVVTGNATVLNPNSVTLSGSISSIGCSPVTTTYGFEYSGISGLANGLGTKVPSTNLNNGIFSATLNGLVPGAKYYYKAYASNNGGLSYGAERSFTTTILPAGFIIYSNPVKHGTSMHYSYKGIKPGHYEIQIFNSNGQLVYQRELIIQVDFIDDNFMVPGNLSSGVYSLQIVSPDFRDKKIFMIR